MTQDGEFITLAQVLSLKQKLTEFSASLTAAEQTILGYVLERDAAGAEVGGYAVPTLFSPAVLTAINADILGINLAVGGIAEPLPGRIAGMGRFANMNQPR